MKHNIDHILNKYWEGGSTLDEEMELKVYFRGNNIDAAHEPYKDCLLYTSPSPRDS